MSPRNLHYVTGDATAVSPEGNNIIAHICNDSGGWGRGFVLAVSARWPEPEREYRKATATGLPLGSIQVIQVNAAIWVANMVAQHGHASASHPAVRYDALETCLSALAGKAMALDAEVHMPRIGIGLGGGSWDMIEPMLYELASSVSVYVHDLPPSS
jgi:O-acetyl-ADP-ribose deacetylase (regulator of RNase III)